MEAPCFAIVVQGLFEKSDSIGYDAAYQYKLLEEMYGTTGVRIFAERFDQDLYPGLHIEPIAELWPYLAQNPTVTPIYHFCDGWPELDRHIIQHPERRFVVRWHNNTPPWFYGASHKRSVERTVRGFRTIVDFIASGNVRFWVNSNFTLEQLKALGGDEDQVAVVYPGSRFLELDTQRVTKGPDEPTEYAIAREDRAVRLLFVGRVVSHKGHKHIIAFAGFLQRSLRRKVSVTFLGRDDPATSLRNDLNAMAKAEGVEAVLKGEVSETELQQAYLNSDIFVCFSEHEGFGMPVFEAMRMGLPVICWGRTALRELMRDHPFQIADLDFAAGVAAVKLALARSRMREINQVQEAILATYTTPIIGKQIEAATAGQFGPWQGEVRPDQSLLDARRTVLADLAELLPEILGTSPHPRDVGDNYVTLHDLESYEALLVGDNGVSHLPERQPQRDFVHFDAKQFISPGALRSDNGVSFNARKVGGHVVYGPYARFPRGFFAADFALSAERNGDPNVALELDVFAEGSGVLASRQVTVSQMSASAPFRLFFPIGDDQAIVEFRIRIAAPGNCNLLFNGVEVRNMRETLEALPAIDPEKIGPLDWLKTRTRRRAEASPVLPSAAAHFSRADELRDHGWWNDAAAEYAQGLALQPRLFGYLVQRGNCLKEAERFAESEQVYHAALELEPEDRDLHLQLGRLYRILDRPQEAHYHLMLAARLDPAAARAMLELATGGFDISSLPQMFA